MMTDMHALYAGLPTDLQSLVCDCLYGDFAAHRRKMRDVATGLRWGRMRYLLRRLKKLSVLMYVYDIV